VCRWTQVTLGLPTEVSNLQLGKPIYMKDEGSVGMLTNEAVTGLTNVQHTK